MKARSSQRLTVELLREVPDHRAPLVPYSLKKSSHLQPGFWGVSAHIRLCAGHVRHAYVPGSHPATRHLSETGSEMASRQGSCQVPVASHLGFLITHSWQGGDNEVHEPEVKVLSPYHI